MFTEKTQQIFFEKLLPKQGRTRNFNPKNCFIFFPNEFEYHMPRIENNLVMKKPSSNLHHFNSIHKIENEKKKKKTYINQLKSPVFCSSLPSFFTSLNFNLFSSSSFVYLQYFPKRLPFYITPKVFFLSLNIQQYFLFSTTYYLERTYGRVFQTL